MPAPMTITLMNTHETVFGLTSLDIAIGSAIVSLASFGVAALLAWKTKFSPPSLAGTFPYAILWTFFEPKNGKPNDFFLVPFFWVLNRGAKPMLAADMRLVVSPDDGEAFTLYPVHSVPAEAIESPNSYSEYESLRAGDAPFGGFSVSAGGTWKNNYVFSLSHEQRVALKGQARLTLEIKQVGKNCHEHILHQDMNFDSSSFDWLSWSGGGGPCASYYYAKELH